MIPSYDLEGTASFFQSLLGFEMIRQEDNYAILGKDRHTIHLLTAGKDIGEMEFYLEVNDVNAVWEGIKDRLTDIRHKGPFDREYGMRELHIVIPHTRTLLFIGQVTA
jgi:catechol 2,3-dioxygenase-like lactoylglutathione lyase family enzyme